MRSHSTKNQLKEKSPEAKFILSNTLHALLLFKIQKDSEFSVDLRQRFSHMPTVPLARSSPPLPPVWSIPHARLASSRRRWRPWPPAPACLAAAETPLQPTGDKNGGSTPFRAAHRPSALRVASCVPAHARGTATVAGKHGTRSLPPTGPRRPVLSNSPPKHQTPARLAPKRNRGPPR